MPKKANKRKYAVSKSRLLDKKINTLFEKRSKEIAQEEIAKARVTLIRRQYLFGEEGFPRSQDFASGVWGEGSQITWDGSVVEISNIPKSDIASQINVPQQDDPETNVNEQLADMAADGQLQLHTVAPNHGERNTESVKVTGFSVAIRASVKRSGTLDPIYDGVFLKYSVVAVKNDDIDIVGWEPPAERVLPMKRFGYDGQLDLTELAETSLIKYKTLLKGKMHLKTSFNMGNVKIKEHHVKLPKPLLLSWNPLDQTGQRPNRVKLFFVIRSTIPAPQGQQDDTYDEYYPTVNACVKTRYFEP